MHAESSSTCVDLLMIVLYGGYRDSNSQLKTVSSCGSEIYCM